MDSILKHPILQFNPDVIVNIRRLSNLDKPGDIDKAVDVLENWLNQQGHLTNKFFPREYLERVIIIQKGSTERAKTAIDRLCTLRNVLPRFFEVNDIKEINKIVGGTIVQVLLPKQTKDNYRVYIPQILRNGLTSDILFSGFQLSTLIRDHLEDVDYSNGIVIISDLTNIDIKTAMKAVNLVDIRQVATIFLEGYNIRVKAVHLISLSTAIELLVKLLKSLVNKKIGDRIHVHKNMEELHKYVPKEILLSEFGGEEKSLRELYAEWTDVFGSDKYVTLFQEIRKSRTNEKYRSMEKFCEEYMGMAGSFRSLTID